MGTVSERNRTRSSWNAFETLRGGSYNSLFFGIDNFFHAHIGSVITGDCWRVVRQYR